MVLDLLGIDYCVSAEARKLIEQEVGIPIDTRADLGRPHAFGRQRPGMRFEFPQKADDYQRFVARRIADGVKCAANRLRPAQLGVTAAQAPEHVFNRRWFLKPGTMPPNPFGGIDQVKMNPPAGSPNLVKPAGPTDPTVSILALREPDDRPIAVYSAYSLHYVGGVGLAIFRPITTACIVGVWNASCTATSRIHRWWPSWPTAPAATSTTSISSTPGRIQNPTNKCGSWPKIWPPRLHIR